MRRTPRSASTARAVALAAIALLTTATVVLSPIAPVFASPALEPASTAVTNGRVFTILQTPTRTYLAGRFTQVGPSTGHGVRVASGTGALVGSSPVVDGPILATAPDGSGGWFIGGDFTTVGGADRRRAAHIDASGSVTSWNPRLNNVVSSIAVSPSSGWVYLGGDFTTAGGAGRLHLAAVTSTTGDLVTTWDAPTDGPVRTLLLRGDDLWIGGAFGIISGANRSAVAVVSASTAAVGPQDAAVSGVVNALGESPDGSVLYIGGDLATIGGQARRALGAVSTASGTPFGWDPAPSDGVDALAVDPASGTVYVGGRFTSLGGVPRLHLAALDPATAAPTAWDPAVDACYAGDDQGCAATVDAIDLATAAEVKIGGAFTTVGGSRRTNSAAIDRSTGVAGSFDPATNARVRALATDATTGESYLGGDLTSANGTDVGRVVALDPSTGALDPTFGPMVNGDVQALALSGDGRTLFLGGAFNRVNDVPRLHLAALNAADGSVQPWRADAGGGQVLALLLHRGRLIVAGKFTRLKGADIKRLGAVDATTGDVDVAFDPKPTNAVWALALAPHGGTLYAGGYFTKMGGLVRSRLAALDPVTGAVTGWAPEPTYPVLALVASPDGSRVYSAGAGRGTTGNRLTSWGSRTGGKIWESFGGDGNIQALGLTADHLYAGGHFTRIDGSDRSRLAVFDPATGRLESYAPKLNSSLGVWAIGTSTDSLLLGGDFTRVGSAVQEGFARMPGAP